MNDADALFDQAMTHHESDQLDRAEALYREALAHNANHPEATHFLGVLCRQRGRNAEGLALIDRSIALDPANPRYHFHLGNALDEDCRFVDAEAAYRRALELEPRYDIARMNLGLVLQSQGRFEPAIETLEKLVELAPNSLNARFNLARVLESVGRQIDSIEQLRQAVAIQRTATTLTWLGGKLRRYGNIDESIDILREAVAADGSDLEAWLELGHSLAAKPDKAGAAEAYGRALRIDPGHEDARFFLAVAQGQTPSSSPRHFIQELYDGYADHFEQHLVGVLKYSAPEQMRDLVSGVLQSAKITEPLDILDLGCGTGLAAPLFKPLAKTLTGVDLSSNMIRQATAKNLYTRLAAADVVEFLRDASAFDLILAIEVLIHLGDLEPTFAAAASALRPGGFFALTVEAHEGPSYAVGAGNRFAHSLELLRALAQKHHLAERLHHRAALRQQKNAPVTGHFLILQKPA